MALITNDGMTVEEVSAMRQWMLSSISAVMMLIRIIEDEVVHCQLRPGKYKGVVKPRKKKLKNAEYEVDQRGRSSCYLHCGVELHGPICKSGRFNDVVVVS